MGNPTKQNHRVLFCNGLCAFILIAGALWLLCAQGLPGTADLDVNGSLAILDQMAARVRGETEGNLYRFQRNPAEFENSEGFFRMIMLAGC